MKFVLALVLAITIGSLIYTGAFPIHGEKFTEFYILGSDGKADNYPQELAVDEQGTVIVGIVNREYGNASYFIDVEVDSKSIGISSTVVLNNDEQWEQPVVFRLWQAGNSQKVEFVLYKDNSPYKECYLWVNVH